MEAWEFQVRSSCLGLFFPGAAMLFPSTDGLVGMHLPLCYVLPGASLPLQSLLWPIVLWLLLGLCYR